MSIFFAKASRGIMENQQNVTLGVLKVDNNQLNRLLMDGYSAKLQERVKIEKIVEEIQQNQRILEGEILDNIG